MTKDKIIIHIIIILLLLYQEERGNSDDNLKESMGRNIMYILSLDVVDSHMPMEDF